MLYADAIFFETPALEYGFRRWLKSDVCKEEQGGFFLCDRPTKRSRTPAGRTLKELRLDTALVIRSVVPVLNLADNPRRSFNMKSWQKFANLGHSLNWAQRLSGWPVWFHTHPSANPEPSPNDWSCAALLTRYPVSLDIFAVVTGQPFAVRAYKPAEVACETRLVEWERLPFLSYRERLFRTASKQAGLYGPPSRHP